MLNNNFGFRAYFQHIEKSPNGNTQSFSLFFFALIRWLWSVSAKKKIIGHRRSAQTAWYCQHYGYFTSNSNRNAAVFSCSSAFSSCLYLSTSIHFISLSTSKFALFILSIYYSNALGEKSTRNTFSDSSSSLFRHRLPYSSLHRSNCALDCEFSRCSYISIQHFIVIIATNSNRNRIHIVARTQWLLNIHRGKPGE